ncbi:MAG: hypothetical protein JW932_18930 [Deltaproteobacteria bacterium]|nr:hypothetical protein [Deltaproteobacteria bacterium]
MKEIVILLKDPDKSKFLQAVTETLFPECKTRVVNSRAKELLKKKGDENAKCPDERS